MTESRSMDLRQQVITKYNNGKSVLDIADELKLTTSYVYKLIKLHTLQEIKEIFELSASTNNICYTINKKLKLRLKKGLRQ